MNVSSPAFTEFRHSLANLAGNPQETGMSDDERLARARSTFIAKLNRRTAVDMETCIHCGMCAEACHFYIATEDERYTPAYKIDPLRRFYRREVSPLRLLYRPITRKMDLDELKEWSELVYEACTGCGRCDMMCPMGINISEGINIMREGLAAAGLVPDELNALQAEQRQSNSLFGVGAAELKAVAAELAQHGTMLPLDKESADILVLTTAVEVRLFPEAIAACAKVMEKSGADWTISTEAFEASNLGLITGDKTALRAAFKRVSAKAKEIGAATVIVPESGHAYQALRWESANALGEELAFEVLAISEYIARTIKAGSLKLKPATEIKSVTYHDPCRLGRQGGVFDEPREALQAMGLDLRETASNRRENLCCGGGCGEYAISHGAPIRQKAFELKKHELDDTQADAVVTGCNNCRINLMIGAEETGWDMPVVSLVETVASNLAE